MEEHEMVDEETLKIVQANYPFIKGQVPSFDCRDPQGLVLIATQKPVILTGCDLVSTAMRWDYDYLGEHLGPGPFAVFLNAKKKKPNSKANGNNSPQSKPKQSSRRNRNHFFKYFDEKKVKDFKEKFVSDIRRQEMSYDQFLVKFKSGNRSKERVYFQQALNSTVGQQIATDFVGFNWQWLVEHQKSWGWGPLTSNLLLIGQGGNVTPCHYDEQQNLLCQLKGQKRVLLFSPDNFPCMYPYPVHHPHDRQSKVDFDFPDFEKFPKFKHVEGVEAVINPGDVLYIPMYWWHHVINVTDTIAINFWHKGGSNAPIEYPLKASQKLAIVRNIEKMLLEALQDQDEVGNVLHWLVDGRY